MADFSLLWCVCVCVLDKHTATDLSADLALSDTSIYFLSQL